MNLSNRHYLVDAALLLGLGAAFLIPHFSLNKFIFGGDVVGYFLPLGSFVSKAARASEFPLWDPYQSSGIPSVALSGFSYPANLLYAIFGFPLALFLVYLIHLGLGGWGAYFLATSRSIGRTGSLLCGCAFMFSSPFLERIWAGHPTYVETFAWIPWLALCALRAVETGKTPWISLAAIAASMLGLLDTFQILLYAFIILAFIWIFRIFIRFNRDRQIQFGQILPVLISLPSIGIVALGLGAAVFLPTLEMSTLIVRTKQPDLASSAISSYSPAELATLLVPDIFGQAGKGTGAYIAGALYHESVVYVGALTLALALLATFTVKHREVRGAALLTCVALLIMMGRYTPLYALMFRFVPGVALFRIPARAHVFVALGLAILAGHGVDFLLQAKENAKLWKVSLVFAIGGFLPGLLAVGMIFSPDAIRANTIQALASISSSPLWGPSLGLEETSRLLSLQWADLAIAFGRAGLALLAGAICIRFLASNSLRKIVSPLLFAVVLLDLWSYGAQFLVSVSESQVYANNDYLKVVTDKKDIYRVYGGSLLPSNGGLLFGYFDTESSLNVLLQRYWDFIAPLGQSKLQDAYAQQTFLPVFDDRVLYMLNVRYAAVSSPIVSPYWKLLEHGVFDRVVVPGFISLKYVEAWIYERIDPLPRAYLVGHCRNLDDESALVYVRSTSFDPLSEVVLPPDQPCRNESKVPIGFATITEYKNNSIDLTVHAGKPGYLVLSEIYYPGWNAYVDGKATSVLRADYTFRAIPIEAGTYQVHLVYQPLSFMLGLLTSLVSLVLIVLVNFIVLRIARHKKITESRQSPLSSN